MIDRSSQSPCGLRRGAAVAASALLAVIAGCSSATPENTSYSFQASNSAVKVDTPHLRALKASTSIAPCPSGTTGSGRTAAAGPASGGLPRLTLPCLGGGPDVDLAGLRGPLLLNFWSQTCGPCRTESPLLQSFATAAQGRVKVMGVDFYDPRPELAIAFASDYGLSYPQLADPAGAAKGPLHIAALPYTFFVDSSGRVTYTQVGPITSRSQLEALVAHHLGVTVPAK